MRQKNTNFNKNVNRGLESKSKNNKSILLPSPSILESYEEIYPGFTEELINLVKADQKQKHEYYKEVQKSINTTQRFGQLLSFLLYAIVLYMSVTLLKTGQLKAAYITLITWFTFLIIININFRARSKFFYKSSNKI